MKRPKSVLNFDDYLNESASVDGILNKLPDEIKTVKDAETLLLVLAQHDMMYHFDDDAEEIFGKEPGAKIDDLMVQAATVCNDHYGITDQRQKNTQTGLWDGLIKDVFGWSGIIAWSAADKSDTNAPIFVHIDGSTDVYEIPIKDWENAKEQFKDDSPDNSDSYDTTAFDNWIIEQPVFHG